MRVRGRTVDWRIVVTAGAGTAIVVLMAALGMEPRFALVGSVVVVVAAAVFLAVDVASVATPMTWHDVTTGRGDVPPQDRRVEILRTRLRRAATVRGARRPDAGVGDEPTDEVARTLLAAIDDHLAAVHGVDRRDAPDDAAAVLGPELARFVLDPTARVPMTRRRSLERTVTLIERLDPGPPTATDAGSLP